MEQGAGRVDRQKITMILKALGELRRDADQANATMLAYLIELAAIEAMEIVTSGQSES